MGSFEFQVSGADRSGGIDGSLLVRLYPARLAGPWLVEFNVREGGKSSI